MIGVTTLIRFTFKVNFFFQGKKIIKGFPDASVGEESDRNAGDTSSIPGSGRSPGSGEGIGYPLRYSSLYSTWGHKQSDTTEQLSFTHSR